MLRITCLLFLAVAACGGSKSEPVKPTPAKPSARVDELVPTCQRIFARKATCADDYLPVLLDLRIELDQPHGIGDTVKAQGRDAVLKVAHTELAADTEPAKVTALCESVKSNMANAPAGRLDQLMDMAAKCEATSDCKAFSSCVVTIDRAMMAPPAP